MDKEITFDRFIRGVIFVLGVIFCGWLINRLSDVLLPFFVAWLLAYMMYPLVTFFQHRLRLRSRALSIVVALLVIIGTLTGAMAIVIPPTIQEFARLSDIITVNLQEFLGQTWITDQVDYFMRHYVNKHAGTQSLINLVQQSSFVEAVQSVLAQAWTLLASTIDLALGLLGIFVILLYMFFILMDYETISHGWSRLIPQGQRHFASMIVQDVKTGMNAYFRGQALVALCVGVLFSIGFLIIDFPLAIGLGLFIGLLNMVPYMQLIGFIPTVLLAFIKASETGQNFWVILLCALAVFAVVQLIQDMILTPKIMGHVMGLNPAVILLSLSIWGSLLGIIGFIIALPLTTLLLSYYRRFVLKEMPEQHAPTPDGQPNED